MTRLAIAVVLFLMNWAPSATGQDNEVKSLRDITGIERDAEAPQTTTLPWLLIAGILVFATMVAGVWLFRAKVRARLGLSADRWAKHELSRIAALNLGAKGNADRHHFLVSNVLRGYIEKRFGVRARRQTTPEFLAEVLQEPRISAEQYKTLDALLTQCDLGKFTGLDSSDEQCRALTEQVLSFIESTRLGPRDG